MVIGLAGHALDELDAGLELFDQEIDGLPVFRAAHIFGRRLVAPDPGQRNVEDRDLLAEGAIDHVVPLLARRAEGIGADDHVGDRDARREPLAFDRIRGQRFQPFGLRALRHDRAAEMRARVGAEFAVVAGLLGRLLRGTFLLARREQRGRRFSVAPGDVRGFEDRVDRDPFVPAHELALFRSAEQALPVVVDHLVVELCRLETIGALGRVGIEGDVHGALLTRSASASARRLIISTKDSTRTAKLAPAVVSCSVSSNR